MYVYSSSFAWVTPRANEAEDLFSYPGSLRTAYIKARKSLLASLVPSAFGVTYGCHTGELIQKNLQSKNFLFDIN